MVSTYHHDFETAEERAAEAALQAAEAALRSDAVQDEPDPAVPPDVPEG